MTQPQSAPGQIPGDKRRKHLIGATGVVRERPIGYFYRARHAAKPGRHARQAA